MTLLDRAQPILRKLDAGQWLPQLLLRLFIGYFFFVSGLGHVRHLDAITERFEGWGIPMPAFNAVLSSYTELIGGALFALGLGTRLISIPLFINMVVATLTVKLKKVTGLGDFVELDEPLYALVFLWFVFSGPGKASLDSVVARALGKPQASAAAPPRAA